MNINNSNDFSFLFGNTGNAGGNGNSFSLTDYANIKKGTYGKVLKSYYAKNPEGPKTVNKEAQDKAKTELNKIRTDATSLKSATEALMGSDNPIYKAKITKDENGKETKTYDSDKIVSALKNFVKSYNAVLDSTVESDDKGILRNAMHMVGMTSKNIGMLSKVGINLDKNNKLVLDEDDAKKADMNALKTMFQGQGSFAGNVASYASRIDNNAANLLKQNGTYTASGSYESSSKTGSSGSIFDSFL